MLSAIVRFSIRFYGIIICLAVLILCIGIYRFIHAGLDIFPEFSPKQVIIQTESAGLSAEQVEVLVTQPIETAINGLVGLKNLRSESIQGLSIVTAQFAEESDVYLNRQLVSERLVNLTTRLPQGITPTVVPLSSSSATVLTIGLTSDQDDLMSLRSFVDWMLVPRLLAVEGVADVNVFGGKIKQLQIQVNPVQLQRFNVSIHDVIETAQQAGELQGSGFIETQNQRFTLQVAGQPQTPEQFAKMPLLHQQHPIMLGEVATIAYAPEPPISTAQIMGKEGIVMMVIGQYGANTLSVSRQVEAMLADFEPIFQKQQIQFYKHLFRPADYIETSVSNLSSHLFIGGLFVVLVLYGFLYNSRTALISALAIPVSLTGAILILLAFGVNLNIMVLGGLAIALGEVVDDAIIDTENIFRRLRENSVLQRPQISSYVIYIASMEVRGSVVYASFIVALAFVPLLTLTGVVGRLFSPLGVAYILAILVSLLVALTLTPALCYTLLGNQVITDTEPPLIRFLKPCYEKLLCRVVRHIKLIMLLSVLLCMAAVTAFFRFENKLLPELREGHFIVHTSSISGTSLAESLRIGKQLTQQFLKIDGVVSVSQWAGRAERGADTYGSHYSEYEVHLKPLSGNEQQQVLEQLRAILKSFPGILYEANTFLTERIDETISGYTSPVVVNIYGHDLNALDSKAEAIAAIMRDIEGATDVQLRSPPKTPMLQIQLNDEQLAATGVSTAQVMDVLQTAYETHHIGKIIQGNKIYNVAVALEPTLRQHTESIAKLPLKARDGSLIRLEQVANVRYTASRYNILRQQSQRRQTVTCNIVNRDFDDFMAELKNRVLNNVAFSADSYPEFTGAAIEQARARHTLIAYSLLAGAGVMMLIYIAIGSLRHTFLTLANLPFALIGGVVAVLLTGESLSVGSVVGFVTLFGITVRNSIMLLAHYRHLVVEQQQHWDLHTMLQGASERLPSILMTALVTALAMFPIAFHSDNAGREIMGPMAAIIIGGLVSSTLLNLSLLPVVLLHYGRFDKAA